MSILTISKLHLFSLVCLAFLGNSCAPSGGVTHAPHRTEVSNTLLGTVVNSYPIRVTKNSGLGAMAAGLGGSAAGYKNLGSGNGRILGAIAGRMAGAITGRAAESKLREKGAQEVTVRFNNKNHRVISKGLPTLGKGDKVMVHRNVYGKVLTLSLVQ